MFIRQSINSYIRRIGEFGYIVNEVMRTDRLFNETGADFLAMISRKPKDVDTIVSELRILYGDSVELEELRADFLAFVKDLEENMFIVVGDSEEELDSKDYCFSYSMGNPKKLLEKRHHTRPSTEAMSTTDLLQNLLRKEPQLVSMLVEINAGCNERCIHCYLPNQKKDTNAKLPFETFKKIVDEYSQLGGIVIVLSGGEAFLHPNIVEMIKYARSKDLFVTVLSNLTPMKDEHVQVLRDERVLVQTSLYSVHPEVHDFITKVKGSCDRTKDAIEKLVSADVPVQISCPIMRANYKEYGDVIRYARAHGCKNQTDYILMAQADMDTKNLANRPTIDEVEYVLRDILNNDLDYRQVVIESASEELSDYLHSELFLNQPICGAGIGDCCITVNGDVYPCAGWQRMVVGNINKQSLKDIWTNSESLKEIRSITQSNFAQCISCEALRYCSRCLVRNYNEGNGDMKSINPHFCDVAFLNKKVVEHFLEEQRNVN